MYCHILQQSKFCVTGQLVCVCVHTCCSHFYKVWTSILGMNLNCLCMLDTGLEPRLTVYEAKLHANHCTNETLTAQLLKVHQAVIFEIWSIFKTPCSCEHKIFIAAWTTALKSLNNKLLTLNMMCSGGT